MGGATAPHGAVSAGPGRSSVTESVWVTPHREHSSFVHTTLSSANFLKTGASSQCCSIAGHWVAVAGLRGAGSAGLHRRKWQLPGEAMAGTAQQSQTPTCRDGPLQAPVRNPQSSSKLLETFCALVLPKPVPVYPKNPQMKVTLVSGRLTA